VQVPGHERWASGGWIGVIPGDIMRVEAKANWCLLGEGRCFSIGRCR